MKPSPSSGRSPSPGERPGERPSEYPGQRWLQSLSRYGGAGLAVVLCGAGLVAWETLNPRRSADPVQAALPQENVRPSDRIPLQLATIAPDITPAKPEASKPEVSKPEISKPEASRLEPAKPSAAIATTIYHVTAEDNQIAFVPQQVSLDLAQANPTPEAKLRAAVESLFKTTQRTAIPEQTRLLSLSIKDQAVYVNVNKQFLKGGGTASMAARVGQILMTIDKQKPGAQVWLLVEGEILKELGGEGLLLDQPLTERKFAAEFNI